MSHFSFIMLQVWPSPGNTFGQWPTKPNPNSQKLFHVEEAVPPNPARRWSDHSQHCTTNFGTNDLRYDSCDHGRGWEESVALRLYGVWMNVLTCRFGVGTVDEETTIDICHQILASWLARWQPSDLSALIVAMPEIFRLPERITK